jgi:hypothetical protein
MSHKYRKVVRRCLRCRNLFVLGKSGASACTYHTRIALCDKCAGVTRDSDGIAWQWESSMEFTDGSIITRAEALGVTR